MSLTLTPPSNAGGFVERSILYRDQPIMYMQLHGARVCDDNSTILAPSGSIVIGPIGGIREPNFSFLWETNATEEDGLNGILDSYKRLKEKFRMPELGSLFERLRGIDVSEKMAAKHLAKIKDGKFEPFYAMIGVYGLPLFILENNGNTYGDWLDIPKPFGFVRVYSPMCDYYMNGSAGGSRRNFGGASGFDISEEIAQLFSLTTVGRDLSQDGLAVKIAEAISYLPKLETKIN